MSRTASIHRIMPAPTEAVWRALTELSEISAWQADVAYGSVEVGGHLLLAWPALGLEVDLDVVELQSHERLVLSSGGSRVVYQLDGSIVTVTHGGLHSEDEVVGTQSSWNVALGILSHYLKHHVGTQRNVVWGLERATTGPETAHAFFTEEAALASWLTNRGGIGPEGSEVDLELTWGEPLSGRVLATAKGRDIAVSWRERGESALVLRTLPAPFSENERLLLAGLSSWGHEPSRSVSEHLRDGLRQLARNLSLPREA